MKLKLFVAMSLFAAIPIVAQAQQKGPAAPKPSTADVQKLVKSIGADPAKVKIYCDVGKLQDQMDQGRAEKGHQNCRGPWRPSRQPRETTRPRL